VFGERQGADALASGSEDGVAQGRENRGESGSPRPVGELSVLRKWTSISAGTWFMRTGGYSWKLLWTAWPPSMVIS